MANVTKNHPARQNSSSKKSNGVKRKKQKKDQTNDIVSRLWKEALPAMKTEFFNHQEKASPSLFKSQVLDTIKKRHAFLNAASRYGTPLYLLDEPALRANAQAFANALKQAFPQGNALYAFKSNDLPYLIHCLKEEGYGADVASEPELRLALALGFTRIIYTAPVKSTDALTLAITHQSKVILNIDNIEELERVLALKRKHYKENPLRISLRLALFANNSKWQKFGLALPQAIQAIKSIEAAKTCALVGFHFHKSWNYTSDEHCDAIKRLGTFLKNKVSPQIKKNLLYVDFGGGFLPPINLIPWQASTQAQLYAYAKKSASLQKRFASMLIREMPLTLEQFFSSLARAYQQHLKPYLPPHHEVLVEPGRYLCANSTAILCKVIRVEGPKAYLDAGIHLLGDATPTFEYAPIINLSSPSLQIKQKILYGPLCDPDDYLGTRFHGKSLSAGDILAVLNQGAYTFSTAWHWQQLIPTYVVWTGDDLVVAKEAETTQARYAQCMLPKKKPLRVNIKGD